MPKVSVIIPVYNTEKYLVKCLESVCQQTLKDIEIICVNDCSPDNSLQILQEYAEKDERIKLIDFKENKGVSAARNAGIQEARGEFLGFVDSDDFIDLNFYEKLYQKAAESGADVAKGKIKIHSDPPNIEKDVFYDINDDIKINKAYFYYSFTSAIYKTDFIKSNNIHFPDGLSYFEDPYFSIFAGFYYNKVELVHNVYYHYVDCEVSLSKKFSSDVFKSIEKIYTSLNQVNVDKKHYIIVYDFLLNFFHPFIFNKEFSIEMNKKAADLFSSMILNCKYKEDAIQYFFYKRQKDQNKLEKKKRFMELKNNFSVKDR